ncbi:MAG TPA: neutral zinc metallopeptidase [Kribbella sp.]|nr:neutral zinc metallopeptidase [Kribbella sp.]
MAESEGSAATSQVGGDMPRFAGGAAPLAAPTPRLGGEAPPPQLTGSRIDSKRLSGTRLGPPPPDDPAAAAYRAVFHPDPIPFVPKKRSKALVAAIVVGALLVVSGGVAFAAKVLSSYDDFVANPMGTPSIRPSGEPTTNEPAGKPTLDADVVKQSPFYTAGKLPVVKCAEPAYRPTSKENVRSYYQALIACMDNAWKPLVIRAGFEFRSPRLIIFDEGDETACGIQKKFGSYCQDEQGGSVTMPWQDLMTQYPKDKAAIRVDMAMSLGFAYGAHLQNLAGILEASDNLRDTAANTAGELEQDRRQALQANCFSAVFFGAAKGSFPLRGELLRQWNSMIQHAGDEHTEDKVRDHGSAKSVSLWMNRGFASLDPATCNTFVASSAKVS